ncbi:hypothetical protein [Mycobacterium avium]|uniref:Uncharacterized protein n=1 Tax=Mycobacterium avium subsp. hominissuis TaxID=439334 RepID=A0AAI8SI29_MYCAV|nr:hypothetical protein [Mycobacterium avium]BBN45613.1 hypothetical protein JPH1_00880 [Mycobacterium avium subsp. hominissuis]
MSIDNESTASRQFVASAAAFSSKWTKGIRYWQAGYTAVFIAFVVFIAVKMLGTLKIVNLRTPHIGAAVIDPNNDAVMAMTWVARVTATPATYRLSAGHAVPSAQHIASDAVGQYFSTMPALRIDIAGMAPLTVGCRAFDGLKQRCSWSPDVPTTHEPPTYAVSAADWQSLVEKLGLAARLADTA